MQTTVAPASASDQAVTRNAGFDTLRLLAAIAVLVGHGFVLTGHGPAPKIGGVPVHALGVDAFFVLSGYLVSESWLRDPHLRRFLLRRVLRILPALVCVVLITVVVVGPMLTSVPLEQYWSSPTTWEYLRNLALVGVYELPGVFVVGHWTSAVNGCLWTLGLEFCGYAVVAAGALLPGRRSTLPMLVLLMVSVVLVVGHGPDAGLGAAGRVWIHFALGALARHLVRRTAHRPAVAVGAVGAWLLVTDLLPAAAQLAWVVVPYAVLTLGLSRRVSLPGLGRVGDLSYGTYLWGFPLQQIVIERFGDLTPGADLAIVVPSTLAVAWLSWRTVELPALRLKPRRPCATAARRPAIALP